jgi:hypothetical protein
VNHWWQYEVQCFKACSLLVVYLIGYKSVQGVLFSFLGAGYSIGFSWALSIRASVMNPSCIYSSFPLILPPFDFQCSLDHNYTARQIFKNVSRLQLAPWILL